MDKRYLCQLLYSRDSSVGIAIRYRLDGPLIGSRWGRGFLHPYKMPWGPSSLLYYGYRVFPGGKAAGPWRWPPNLSSAKVKRRVELYIYSFSGSSWHVLGWLLPYLMTVMILFKIIFIICLFSVFKRGFLWRINNQRFLSLNISVGTVHSFGMNRVAIKHSSGCKEGPCYEQEGFDVLRDKPNPKYFVIFCCISVDRNT